MPIHLKWIDPAPAYLKTTKVYGHLNAAYVNQESSLLATLPNGVTEYIDEAVLPGESKNYILRTVYENGQSMDTIRLNFLNGAYYGCAAYADFDSTDRSDTRHGHRGYAYAKDGIIFTNKQVWDLIDPALNKRDPNTEAWRQCIWEGKVFYLPSSTSHLHTFKFTFNISDNLKEYIAGKEIFFTHNYHKYKISFPTFESKLLQTWLSAQFAIRMTPEHTLTNVKQGSPQAFLNDVKNFLTADFDPVAKKATVIQKTQYRPDINKTYFTEGLPKIVDETFTEDVTLFPIIEFLGLEENA